MQLQSNWDYELSRNKNTRVSYLDVFWRSAQFLLLTKCGVMEANKKQGGGGSLLMEDCDGTSEWMSRIDNECKNLSNRKILLKSSKLSS